MHIKKNIFSIVLFLTPISAWAAPPANFKELVSWVIRSIINPTTALLITVAVAFFFWGVFRYILSQGSQVERAKGVQLMIRGIIALFLIITFWGFAKMLVSSFF